MRASIVPPVKFSIGSEVEEEEANIKAMLSTRRTSSETEMGCCSSGQTATTSDPVGLLILIHKPKALTTLSTVINKVGLSRLMISRGVNYPGMLRNTSLPLGFFLEACRLCNKKLSPGKDVYMYRGDQAFCSTDCRCERILLDEMCEREEEYLTRRPTKVASPPLRCNDGKNHEQAESHRRRDIWATG